MTACPAITSDDEVRQWSCCYLLKIAYFLLNFISTTKKNMPRPFIVYNYDSNTFFEQGVNGNEFEVSFSALINNSTKKFSIADEVATCWMLSFFTCSFIYLFNVCLRSSPLWILLV